MDSGESSVHDRPVHRAGQERWRRHPYESLCLEKTVFGLGRSRFLRNLEESGLCCEVVQKEEV